MWRKLLFFCILYFVQGAALAYVVNFQKPYLAAEGISKGTIGFFTSLLLIPFIIKVGLGYISDRFPLGRWGSRKPYMLMGLTLFASGFASLALIRPSQNFLMFGVLVWIASFGLAWFDTCADAWAVDSAHDHEQSAVQASMIGGKSLGLITMASLFGWLAGSGDFSPVFLTIAALAVVVFVIIIFTPYEAPKKRKGELVHGWRGLLQPFYIFFALYAMVYALASFGTDGLLTLHLQELRKASSLDIGFFGMFRGGGGLIGAALFAFLQPRLGIKFITYGALFILGFGCLIPLAGMPANIAAAMWGAAWGFQETAFVTLAMRFAQGRWAATLFAASMIFSNVGNSLGEAMGAPLVPQIGFNGVFIMFAVVAWATMLLLPKVLKPI